jgi:hypothetical protein
MENFRADQTLVDQITAMRIGMGLRTNGEVITHALSLLKFVVKARGHATNKIILNVNNKRNDTISSYELDIASEDF